MSDNASLLGGLFVGAGADKVTEEDPLPSEYGVVPTTVYASIILFF